MKIEVASIRSFCQTGKRPYQEDSRWPDTDKPDAATSTGTFVVCDGVGGCEKGEVASSTVCNAISKKMADHRPSLPFDYADLGRLLDVSFSALDAVATPENKGMATTLALLVINDKGCLVANIGDSRIYQVRPGEGIIFRSEDHSLVNSLLRSGNLTPDKVADHPQGNVITRCMTPSRSDRERDTASAVNLTDISAGDYFFLCSDGVVHCVSDADLEEILSAEVDDDEKISVLANLSKDSNDNNTAILVRIGEVGEKPDEPTSSANTEDASATQRLSNNLDTMRNVSSTPAPKSEKIKTFFTDLFKKKNQ